MKKGLKVTLIIIVIILLFGIITGVVDYGRTKDNKPPIFTVKLSDGKTGKITYLGIGYKVVGYWGVSINEPFEQNISLKFGSWFMKFEIPKDNENK